MYSLNFYKYKPYYVSDVLDCKKIANIKKMLKNNVSYSIIKESIDELVKESRLFINLIDNCSCLEIIQIQIDRLIQQSSSSTSKQIAAFDPIITTIETKLDMRYVNYIIKYGVPENGEFNEELLNSCACLCDE
jgi:hypothetical protein